MSQKIRVAQVVGKMSSGGVESTVMNYYRHIDHELIQFDFLVDSDSQLPQREEIERLGGKIILVPPYQHIFSYIWTLIKLFKKNKYPIVHSHLNTLSVFPLFAAYIAKVPVRIAHAHSTANWKEKMKTAMKYTLKICSKVFATNYFACSREAGIFQFGNRAMEHGKVLVVPNAIDLTKFQFDSQKRKKQRDELKIKKDTLVIGHVGRFDSSKNHEFLLDVFREIHEQKKNSVLLLAGEGKLEEKIRKRVNELNLADAVYFLGVRKDIENIYFATDVFFLPSLYEGLGMVLIEAQFSGCQCYASTNVPSEVQVSNKIKFLKLDDGSVAWAEKVLKDQKEEKMDRTDSKMIEDYDIRSAARTLAMKYMSLK